MEIKSICVYCGSSPGRQPEYVQAAQALGAEIGKRGIQLVYGGARVGLMGEVARAALTAGGKVIGIMPKALVDQEIACVSEIELRVVNDMHERKAAMADLSDGFIAMPGGFGTFEEFFEVLTWQQLGIHSKPCGLLNIQGYYDGLLSFIDHAVEEMFIHHSNKDLILASKDPAQLIEQFLEFQPVKMDKARWVREMADSQSTD